MGPNPIGLVPLQEEEIKTQTHRGKTLWKHRKGKMTTYKPKRAASEGTNAVNILILDLKPPELSENKLWTLKPPNLCHGGLNRLIPPDRMNIWFLLQL